MPPVSSWRLRRYSFPVPMSSPSFLPTGASDQVMPSGRMDLHFQRGLTQNSGGLIRQSANQRFHFPLKCEPAAGTVSRQDGSGSGTQGQITADEVTQQDQIQNAPALSQRSFHFQHIGAVLVFHITPPQHMTVN